MKKIVNGKAYNTETGTVLASTKHRGYQGYGEYDKSFASYRNPINDACTSTLYQTRGGAFFLVRDIKEGYVAREDVIGGSSDPIFGSGLYPISRRQAIAWAERNVPADQVESIFGQLPEAGTKSGSILVRLPETLKKSVEASAREAQQSTNAWILRCLEQGVKSGPSVSSEEARPASRKKA